MARGEPDWRGRVANIITGQELPQVITRHGFGTVESSAATIENISPAQSYEFVNYTGKGYLYWYYVRVLAETGSHLIQIWIRVDDVALRFAGVYDFKGFYSMGFNTNTKPLQLLKYAQDGECAALCYFNPPLAFDSSLILKVVNGSTSTQKVIGAWFYTKL